MAAQYQYIFVRRQSLQVLLLLQRVVSVTGVTTHRRPGETILLEATADGEPHVVTDVLIKWPLHIVGGGMSPADTVIQVTCRVWSCLCLTLYNRVASWQHSCQDLAVLEHMCR